MSEDLDESQKKKIWQVWGELFPVCIDNAPLNLRFNSARFCKTMQEFIEYLDVNTGVKVLKAWYNRIDSKIKNEEILDEFEMSIADILMQLTSTDFNARKELFSQLITYNDTNFILSSLKWIVRYWNELEDFEKNMILDLINSNRIDVRWIKAVLLNSYSPPKEVLKEILGDQDLFKKNTKQIVMSFPDVLIKDCLHVYCGFPQPLYWLALHHNNEFWLEALKYILLNEKHVGFDICLKKFVDDCVNGYSSFEKEEGMNLWSNICLTVKHKDILTISLINSMVNSSFNIPSTKGMWSVLIESYETVSKIEDLVKCIVENIEMILYNCRNDFFRVIDEDFIQEKLFPELQLLKLTKENIEKVGKKRKEELRMSINYKLENWIGIN